MLQCILDTPVYFFLYDLHEQSEYVFLFTMDYYIIIKIATNMQIISKLLQHSNCFYQIKTLTRDLHNRHDFNGQLFFRTLTFFHFGFRYFFLNVPIIRLRIH